MDKGASLEEASRVLAAISRPTLLRYENAWQKFQHVVAPEIYSMACQLLAQDIHLESNNPEMLALEILKRIPLWRLALWLKKFVGACSLSQGRNVYSALILLPPCQQLKWETLLSKTKRGWNVSRPKYSTFFDVEPILSKFARAPIPCSEEEIRLRLILLMRLVGLFRGIDLARSKRSTIQFKNQPWFLESKRKGRSYYMHYPIPELQPPPVQSARNAATICLMHGMV